MLAPRVVFGQRGQWAILGSSSALSISNLTYSNSQATFFNATGAIGIDYFVVNNVSIGLDLEATYSDDKGYGTTSLIDTTSSTLAGGVRFGLNVPLGQWLSWYPRLTLLLASDHQRTTPISSANGAAATPSSSQSTVGPALSVFAPLLVHPAPHLVVGFGPRLEYDLGVTRGGPNDGSQLSWYGVQCVVGGYWGGAVRESTERTGSEKLEGQVEDAFGKKGQLVLTMGTDASAFYRSYSHGKGSRTDLSLSPSFDYFAADDISVGLDASVSYTSGMSLDSAGATRFSSTNFGVAPRLGGNVVLSEFASIWFLGELGYGVVEQSLSSESGSNVHTRHRTWFAISTPVLLHPSRHFFVGAGPFLFHELSDKDQVNAEIDATNIGLSLIIGGYFDLFGERPTPPSGRSNP